MLSHVINTYFIKIKFDTHDNIGSGPNSLPGEELHTTPTWYNFDIPEGWTDVGSLLQTLAGGQRNVL